MIRIKFNLKRSKSDFIELINEISKKDLLLVLVLPVITGILIFLPAHVQEMPKLNIHNPTWWQFLTSSFVLKKMESGAIRRKSLKPRL